MALSAFMAFCQDKWHVSLEKVTRKIAQGYILVNWITIDCSAKNDGEQAKLAISTVVCILKAKFQIRGIHQQML